MQNDPITIDRVRLLLAEGLNQNQVAKRLGTSPSTISRLLADHRDDDGYRPAQDAVDAFVRSLGPELAPDVAARVEALRGLARKLDWTGRANTGTAAMAASSLAREYRNLLDELRVSSSFDELREALLASDDD
jgi:transcriptional regulator with XRE-family HTH domain